MKKPLFIALVLGFVFQQTIAQPKAIPLYPDGVPNSIPAPASYAEKFVDGRYYMVTEPTITPYFPQQGTANGTAVIICPGGGYARLAVGGGDSGLAKKFTSIGITAFLLKYRLPNDTIMVDKSIGPMQDIQRAIQMVRERAAEWGINPNKVGISGGSAGGHVAAIAGTHYDKAFIENKKNTNLRPDFLILQYPVITFGALAHQGSINHLVGKKPTADQIEFFSAEKHVNSNTPLTFIVVAEDDKTVPVENSIMFYQALVKAKVKAELIIYPEGGHGFGLNNKTTKDHWFDNATNWLDANGFLTR